MMRQKIINFATANLDKLCSARQIFMCSLIFFTIWLNSNERKKSHIASTFHYYFLLNYLHLQTVICVCLFTLVFILEVLKPRRE